MVGNNRLKIMKQFCGDTARCRLQPTLYTEAKVFALKKLIAAHQSQLQKFLKILNHPTWLAHLTPSGRVDGSKPVYTVTAPRNAAQCAEWSLHARERSEYGSAG